MYQVPCYSFEDGNLISRMRHLARLTTPYEILSDCFVAIDKTEKNMHFEIVISRGSYFEFRIRREGAPDVNYCSFVRVGCTNYMKVVIV